MSQEEEEDQLADFMRKKGHFGLVIFSLLKLLFDNRSDLSICLDQA